MSLCPKEMLLVQGQIFGLLSRTFDYPDEELRKDLSSGNFSHQISEALRNLPPESELERSAANLTASLEQLSRNCAELEEEYCYLFLRNVLVPANESHYAEHERQGLLLATLSELASFYRAFGLQVGEKAGELADHVTAELEFLSALFLKEAYAMERGWQEKAIICRDARKKFLKEHPGRWFAPFSKALHEKARLSFYPSLAEFTELCLSLELKRTH